MTYYGEVCSLLQNIDGRWVGIDDMGGEGVFMCTAEQERGNGGNHFWLED